jgi:hypothetical protein
MAESLTRTKAALTLQKTISLVIESCAFLRCRMSCGHAFERSRAPAIAGSNLDCSQTSPARADARLAGHSLACLSQWLEPLPHNCSNKNLACHLTAMVWPTLPRPAVWMKRLSRAFKVTGLGAMPCLRRYPNLARGGMKVQFMTNLASGGMKVQFMTLATDSCNFHAPTG